MLTVSNYHYIREDFNFKYPSIFGVTPIQFKNQIELLKDQGSFVSISDLLEHTEEVLTSKENYFLITFDDGLKEQYEYAVPIMEDLKVDGLFFINTINHEEHKVSTVHKIHLLRSEIHSSEIMKKTQEVYDFEYTIEDQKKAHQTYRFDTKEDAEIKYLLNFLMPYIEKEKLVERLFKAYFDETDSAKELYMSEDQIKELAQRKYIGSHTHSHKPLGLFDRNTIEYELEHAKKYLEQMTKEPIHTVSYPYGTQAASPKIVQELSKKTGHDLGFNALKGINTNADNLFFLNRFDCNDLIGGKNYEN